ncbi:MAG: response regulator [Candidatus Omnitrophica bacterium]|nr:response regulator [Candidatus Omnitrophota bacterium]
MSARMLIVDDDKTLCEELADYFQEAGFSAEYVSLPEEGIVRLSQNSYDVLLLDYKMPQFDGVEFLKRSKESLGNMKVFLISGSLAVPQMLKEQGLSSFVTHVFPKPFNIQTLHSAVNDAVEQVEKSQ